MEKEREICPQCSSEAMIVQENEEGGYDVLCKECGYCVWGSIEKGWDGHNTLSQEVKFVLEEIRRQLKIAKRFAKTQDKWGTGANDAALLGAYHQGRLEALESIDSKLRSIRL